MAKANGSKDGKNEATNVTKGIATRNKKLLVARTKGRRAEGKRLGFAGGGVQVMTRKEAKAVPFCKTHGCVIQVAALK